MERIDFLTEEEFEILNPVWVGVNLRFDLAVWLEKIGLRERTDILNHGFDWYHSLCSISLERDAFLSKTELDQKFRYDKEKGIFKWNGGAVSRRFMPSTHVTIKGRKYLTCHIMYVMRFGEFPKNRQWSWDCVASESKCVASESKKDFFNERMESDAANGKPFRPYMGHFRTSSQMVKMLESSEDRSGTVEKMLDCYLSTIFSPAAYVESAFKIPADAVLSLELIEQQRRVKKRNIEAAQKYHEEDPV